VRFLIENFGPVKKADILIKPLTIFIGPNASGKSYIAYLLWCLCSTEPNFDALLRVLPRKKVSDENLNRTTKRFLLEIFEDPIPMYKDLEDHLKNTFRVDDIRVLTRRGAQKCKFRICSDNKERGIKFNITDRGVEFVTEGLSESMKQNLGIKARHFRDRTFLEMFWKRARVDSVQVESHAQSSLIRLIPATSFYLLDGYIPFANVFIAPDGRAGLIRTRELIVSQAFTARKQAIAMSAVDLAFMRDFEILGPGVKDKRMSELTDFIEETLLIEFKLRRAAPQYAVRIKGLEFPLHSAPSGYRELAPLALALRHGRWSCMFIEEPEAHLHPDAQTIVARAVAAASKRDVDIIATTHSIHVLDEISNLLRLNKLSGKEKKALGYKNWEGLSPEDVGIYFFSKEGDVELIDVSEDGLSETGLDKIVLEMANKHAAVERLFEKREA